MTWEELKQIYKLRKLSSKRIFILKVDIETALATKWIAICFTNKGVIYEDINGEEFIFDFLNVHNSNGIEKVDIGSIEGLNKPLPFQCYSSHWHFYTMLSLIQNGNSWYYYSSNSHGNHVEVIRRKWDSEGNQEKFKVEMDYLKECLCKKNGFIDKYIKFNHLS